MDVINPPTPVPGTLPALRDALAAEGLPVDDLCEPGRRFFDFAVGFGGLESCGAGTALLRSVVVFPQHRGCGYGRRIAEALLSIASAQGAREVWILTTSAAGLFAKLGFVDIPRNAVPAAIAATRQFSTLCPASAKAMRLLVR